MKKRMIALTMAAVMAVPFAAQTTVLAEEVPTLTIFVDETWWPYEKWEGAVPGGIRIPSRSKYRGDPCSG